MKRRVIIIAIVAVAATSAFSLSFFAQENPESVANLASHESAKYSFEAAKLLVKEGKIQEAIWVLIDLYPTDPERTVKEVLLLKEKVPDLPKAIKSAFAASAPFDSEISRMENGTLILNKEGLSKKGKWADDMISKVKSAKP